MAVVFVFFMLIAAYICAIPVKIALHLRIADRIRFSSGVSIFEGKYADKLADKHARGRKKPPALSRWIKNAEKRRSLLSCTAALRHFYRHIHLNAISASGTISLSDAAHTAILCGGAKALSASLHAHPQIYISLRPDFSSEHSNALIRGMFSISAGHIILAAIEGIAHYIKEEFTQWKNTRLKIS